MRLNYNLIGIQYDYPHDVTPNSVTTEKEERIGKVLVLIKACIIVYSIHELIEFGMFLDRHAIGIGRVYSVNMMTRRGF